MPIAQLIPLHCYMANNSNMPGSYICFISFLTDPLIASDFAHIPIGNMDTTYGTHMMNVQMNVTFASVGVYK